MLSYPISSQHEYGAKCSYEDFPVHKACWVKPDDAKADEFKEFRRIKQKFLAHQQIWPIGIFS